MADKQLTITATLEDDFTRDFRRLVQGFDRLVDTLSGAQRQTDRLATSQDRLGDEAAQATRQITNQQRALDGLGRVGTRVLSVVSGLAAGFGLGQSLQQFAQFEAGLVGVQKTANLTRDEVKQLDAGIRDLAGGRNALPVAVNQLQEITQAAGQVGVQGVDNLLAFTDIVARLGTATDLEGGTAVEFLQRLSTLTGTAPQRLENLGSTLVDLGNNFNVTEREIAEFSVNLAAPIQSIGLTASQVTGLSTVLSELGAPARLSGSVFFRTFTQISEAVINGGEQLDRFAQVSNVSAETFTEAFRENPLDALLLFVEGLGNLDRTAVTTAGVLEDLGLAGDENAKVLEPLAANVDRVREALETASGAFEENVALQRESALFAETTSARLQVLRNRIQLVAVNLGEQLVPAFERFADALEENLQSDRAQRAFEILGNLLEVLARNFDLVVAAASAFVALKVGTALFTAGRAALAAFQSIRTLVVGIRTFVAQRGAILAVIDGFAKIAPFIRAAIPFVARFAALFTGPIGIVVGIVTALVAALAFLRTRVESVDEALTRLEVTFEVLFEVVGNVIEEGINFWVELFAGFFDDVGEVFTNGVAFWVETFSGFFEDSKTILTEGIAFWTEQFEKIPGFDSLRDKFNETVEATKDIAREGVEFWNEEFGRIGGFDTLSAEVERRTQARLNAERGAGGQTQAQQTADFIGEAVQGVDFQGFGAESANSFNSGFGPNVRTKEQLEAEIQAIQTEFQQTAAEIGLTIAQEQQRLATFQLTNTEEDRRSGEERIELLNREIAIRQNILAEQRRLAAEQLQAARDVAQAQGVDETPQIIQARSRLVQVEGELFRLSIERSQREMQITRELEAQAQAIALVQLENQISSLETERDILSDQRDFLIEIGQLSRTDALDQELAIEQQILETNLELVRAKADLADDEVERIRLLQEVASAEQRLAAFDVTRAQRSADLSNQLISDAQSAEGALRSQLQSTADLVEAGSITQQEAQARNIEAFARFNGAIMGTRSQLQALADDGRISADQLGQALQELESVGVESFTMLDDQTAQTLANIQQFRQGAEGAFQGFFSDLIRSGGDFEQAFQGLLANLADSLVQFLSQELTQRLATPLLDVAFGPEGGAGGALGQLFGVGAGGSGLELSSPDTVANTTAIGSNTAAIQGLTTQLGGLGTGFGDQLTSAVPEEVTGATGLTGAAQAQIDEQRVVNQEFLDNQSFLNQEKLTTEGQQNQGFLASIGERFTGLIDGIGNLFSNIGMGLNTVFQAGANAFGSTISTLSGVFNSVVGSLTSTFTGFLGSFNSITSTLVNSLGNVFSSFVGSFGNLLGGLGGGGGGGGGVGAGAGLLSGIGSIVSLIPGIGPILGGAISLVGAFFNSGGEVPGPDVNRDIIPAWLTPGEFVLPRGSASYYGRGVMEALRRRLIPREAFAGSGMAKVMRRPISGPVKFQTGGEASSPLTSEPGSGSIVGAVVANTEENMRSLLDGGPNAVIEFFENNAGAVNAALGR